MTYLEHQTNLSADFRRVEQQRHQAEEHRRKAKEKRKKAINRRCFLIGEKVCAAFPELADRIELQQLDAILARLQSHDELVQAILSNS